MLTAKEAAIIAVKALDDRLGSDIRLLRIDELSSVADYFVICTGTSNTHISSLSDAVERAMTEAGEELGHIEGHRSGTWVLLDFGAVVIHIFTDDARKFYSLERLWSDAEPVSLDGIINAEQVR